MSKKKIKNGYYLSARQMFDSDLWQCPADEIKLAHYLIGTARHNKKPKRFPGFQVCRGELVTSMSLISENCQWYENRKVRSWSRQKVARMLKKLVDINFISLKSDTYGTHISICNYSEYQNPDNYKSDERGTTVTQPSPYCDTTVDTYNKEYNVKNVNNENKNTGEGGFKSCKDLRAYLKQKISASPDLKKHHDKIIEFFNHRMMFPKKDRYRSEKGIDGLIRDCTNCFNKYISLDRCIDIAMQKETWKTPDANYFEKLVELKPATMKKEVDHLAEDEKKRMAEGDEPISDEERQGFINNLKKSVGGIG